MENELEKMQKMAKHKVEIADTNFKQISHLTSEVHRLTALLQKSDENKVTINSFEYKKLQELLTGSGL